MPPMFKGVISDIRKPIGAKNNWHSWQWPVLEDLWMPDDNKRATEEGWCITCNGPPPWYITMVDLLIFTCAEDAQRWVGERADAGSEFHARALAAVMAFNIKGKEFWSGI